MIKELTCHIICCDGCETEFGNGDYTVHYDDPDTAIDDIEDTSWKVTRDGKVFCPAGECSAKMPACRCADEDMCGCSCAPGCPCVLHEQIEPDGPCEDCGETFERQSGLAWHRYSVHGKRTVMKRTLAWGEVTS